MTCSKLHVVVVVHGFFRLLPEDITKNRFVEEIESKQQQQLGLPDKIYSREFGEILAPDP